MKFNKDTPNGTDVPKESGISKHTHLLNKYQQAEKEIKGQINQIDLTIRQKQLTYEKEINALTQQKNQLITQFSSVVGGIEALKALGE